MNWIKNMTASPILEENMTTYDGCMTTYDGWNIYRAGVVKI